MQQMFLGPSGPNAAVVDWHVTDIVRLDPEDWPRHDGDPDAHPYNPRGWAAIGGFALKLDYLRGVVDRSTQALPGVAYLSRRGRVLAGLLPHGTVFGVDPARGTRNLIGRVGLEPLYMSPAMIDPGTSEIWIPPKDDVECVRLSPDYATEGFENAPVV